MNYKIPVTGIILFLGLFFYSCSDNPASVDEEVPDIPDLSFMTPDFTYFDSNASSKAKSSDEAYTSASFVATFYSGLLHGMATLPENLVNSASNENASFNGGTWTWEYSHNYNGESLSIRMTASEGKESIDWNLYLTANTSQFQVDSFKYMNGSTALDGSNGIWRIYSLTETQSDEPVVRFDWERTGEEEYEVGMDFGSGQEASFITYNREGPVNQLSVTDQNSTTVIYWDTDENVGFYQDSEGVRICWNQSLQDVACSEVNLTEG